MISVFSRICRNMIAAFSCLLFSLTCFAVDNTGSLTQPALPSPIASAFQMLFGLGVVLLLIAGMAWMLKKFTPGQVGSHGDLRVVSAVAVGAKERVVLVDVGDTRLVLGVAPGNVVKLLEMSRTDKTEQVADNEPPKSFVMKLKEVIARRGES